MKVWLGLVGQRGSCCCVKHLHESEFLVFSNITIKETGLLGICGVRSTRLFIDHSFSTRSPLREMRNIYDTSEINSLITQNKNK